MKHSTTLKRIDAQINRIDELVYKLLNGDEIHGIKPVDISEMSAYERMNVASRFMALSQRGIALRQTCELDQPENRETMLIAAFMRQMRGETPATLVTDESPLQGLPEPDEDSDDG